MFSLSLSVWGPSPDQRCPQEAVRSVSPGAAGGTPRVGPPPSVRLGGLGAHVPDGGHTRCQCPESRYSGAPAAGPRPPPRGGHMLLRGAGRSVIIHIEAPLCRRDFFLEPSLLGVGLNLAPVAPSSACCVTALVPVSLQAAGIREPASPRSHAQEHREGLRSVSQLASHS